MSAQQPKTRSGGGNSLRKRRGIWKQIDGSKVRYELCRKAGLKVRRGRRRPERVISFADLLDLAEGQLKMNLL
jgi:hypothetical protein